MNKIFARRNLFYGFLILVCIGIIGIIYLNFSDVSKSKMKEKDNNTIEKAKIEKFVENFVSRTFSDFSSTNEYDISTIHPDAKKLMGYISYKKEFIQYLKDIYNLSYNLKSRKFTFKEIRPLQENRWEVLLDVFYEYDDIRDGVAIGSGEVITYKILVEEKENEMLVLAAISNDFSTESLLNEDLVIETYNLTPMLGKREEGVSFRNLEEAKKNLIKSKEMISEENNLDK